MYLYVLRGIRKYSCRYEGTLIVNIMSKISNWNTKRKNYAFTCNSLSGTFPGFEFRQGQEIFLLPENPYMSSAPSPSPTSLLFNLYRGASSRISSRGVKVTTHHLVPR